MTRRILQTLLASAALIAGGATPVMAATSISDAHGFAPGVVVVKFRGQRPGRALTLPAGAGVHEVAAALRSNPRVAYAAPDYIATASAAPEGSEPLDPDDPGTLSEAPVPGLPGDWALKQWNFLAREGPATPRLPTSPGGIDVVGAWRNLIDAGRPGGKGITVAVLDTGVAYRSYKRFRRSPDFSPSQFVPGYDFVGHDRLPLDENGHGTHVAGTIGERTDNGIGLTGIAYGAKLMPVRVLDRHGRGDSVDIFKGIRFAVANGADVINMSFNFGCRKRVPIVDEALRAAYAKGVVTVASAGNLGSENCVSEPATGPHVIGVGGTTEGGCLGSYSLAGNAIDLVAPGGGTPRRNCPSVSSRPIYQVTLQPNGTDSFTIPVNFVGTSMAAAHVSGVAALILASGTLAPRPLPRKLVDAVRRRLRRTAQSLGLPATRQGAGLIDAELATRPLPQAPLRGAGR
jgi:serine protease